jgi:tetratricopeptide (TPR) repeat protein
MNLTLRLQYDDGLRRPAAAWFVVGATAEAWLAELADWNAPLGQARLFVVPTSLADRRPCGVLVVGAAPSEGRATPGSLPYAAADRRLFVPCDARLDPDLSAAELAALVGDDTYVWHPQAGLVAIPESAARRVADLVAVPPSTAGAWTIAVPGVALNAKLVSIEPEITPTAQDVLNEGRGDIGSQTREISQLPPSPDEPATGFLADVSNAIGKGIANAARWLSEQAPQGGGQSGKQGRAAGDESPVGGKSSWLSALGEWAEQRLQGISHSMEAARNRELLRLMNLLQTNPDEGLKFALPWGGGEHRGIARPSSVLGSRDVNFSLGGLRGGGPADVWDVPAEMQRRLWERYRELAAREIALGRHRRAAYIFASLLNDIRSAASTLADGGHYREAAALYEEKLRQPELAAECLRKGRCWAEAIAIYERLGKHEIVGDLYAELEQPDDAAVAWRRAVAAHLQTDDVIAAAKLLEGKLAAPDEAYEHLSEAWWRHSRQRSVCLSEAFDLNARHMRPDRARKLVERLSEVDVHSPDAAPTASLLSAQAVKYPDAEIRAVAADRTRIVVARQLATHVNRELFMQLVGAVERLVPEDRLLLRDGRRYVNERSKRPTAMAPTTPTATHLHAAPTVFRELRLPPGVAWKSAVATDDAIFAAGYRGRELVVVRTDWKGTDAEEAIGAAWEIQPSFIGQPPLLVPDPSAENLIVHVSQHAPLHQRWFKVSDRFPQATSLGAHRAISEMTYACCRSGRDVLHVVDAAEGMKLVAQAHFLRAQLGGVQRVDLLKLTDVGDSVHVPLPAAVAEETLCVGIGRNLCFTAGSNDLRILELPHAVTQLVASPQFSRQRLIVALEQGGLVLWGNDDRATKAPFASDMESPRVALSRDGTLIAASAEQIEMYSTSDGRLRLRGRYPGTGTPPVAVLTTRLLNRYALLRGDGRLTIHDVGSI